MISQQSPSSTKIELPFIHSLINVKCTMCQRCLDKKTEPLLIRNQAGSLVSAQKMWLMLCSVQSLSCVRLFVTPWTAACQASLSITNSRSLLKVMSIASVMPSNHLILCCPLLLPPSIFPSISLFSNELVLCIRWPKYCQLQPQSFQWIFRTDFLFFFFFPFSVWISLFFFFLFVFLILFYF